MTSKFLLFLLPAIVYGRIQILIKPSLNQNDASVEVLGSSADIITEKERATFRIQDQPLKDAIQKYSGGRPNDAYVHSPTPWNDLYSRYGWRQIERIVYPKSYKILGISSEPVIVKTEEFQNNSTVKAKYSSEISQTVEKVVSSTWSKSGEISMGQEITYSIGFGDAEIGGATRFSYTSSWGEETSKSETVTVGSISVQVELEPGQRATATLSATRGSMTVEVLYEANLDGDVACNYADVFRGHHFYAYDINDVLVAGGLPQIVVAKEVITVGFYSTAFIIVDDVVTKRSLSTIPIVL